MPILAWNVINYMRTVAGDLLGDWPLGEPYTPPGESRPTEWVMDCQGRTQELADHMRSYGYQVTLHGPDRIGVSGCPTNVEAIRALEIKQAEGRIAWLRTADDDCITQLASRM